MKGLGGNGNYLQRYVGGKKCCEHCANQHTQSSARAQKPVWCWRFFGSLLLKIEPCGLQNRDEHYLPRTSRR
jgi:hypothetical protein